MKKLTLLLLFTAVWAFSNAQNLDRISMSSGAAYNGSTAGVDAIIIPNYPSNKNGFVGIGIEPEQKFHISDVMRLELRNTVPSSPSVGDIYM